ncbi:MAG: hypothetical protein QOF39_1140 [Frankiales bacterium]|nr:hypothetical protein [Frankiales bacterium]
MTVGFRHGDPRFPFWSQPDRQPEGRWHGSGEGPVHYLADTPDGAWAEFLRHEEITEPAELAGVRRRLWAVEFDRAAETERAVPVPRGTATGGFASYPACQAAARRLRGSGTTCLRAPSAALLPGGAGGEQVLGPYREGSERDGVVWVLIGPRPQVRGWAAVDAGAPTRRVLRLVAHFDEPAVPAAAAGHRTGSDRRSGADRRDLVDLTRAERGQPERRRPGGDQRRGTDRRAR